MKRVLLLLDGIVLFGRERGNIDVLEYLKGNRVQVMVAVHEHWGKEQIVPHLEKLEIPWCELDFHDRLGRDAGLLAWLMAAVIIAKANLQLALRLLRTPTKVIQITNPQTLLNFLPLLWLIRKPVVMRCGDTPAAHTAAHRWLWRVCFRRVNRFVAISEHVAERLLDLGCPAAKLRTIYSRPFSRPGGGAALQRPDSPGLVLGFIGQLEKHKGIDHLLEACSRLNAAGIQFELRVAGSTTACWRQLAERFADARWLQWIGFVEDTAEFFAGLDLLVVPSVCEEGLGAVVVEAKQAGVGAVVYPSGALPELIEPGVDGQVCGAASVDSLADCLQSLCRQPALIRSMGEAAARSAARLERQFESGWDAIYAS